MNKDNVTAEDLVRALRAQVDPMKIGPAVEDVAKKLNVKSKWTRWDDGYWMHLANLIIDIALVITLPEDKPQTIPAVVYRKGEPPFVKQYKVVADYQDEVLPFSEPINGVEQ